MIAIVAGTGRRDRGGMEHGSRQTKTKTPTPKSIKVGQKSPRTRIRIKRLIRNLLFLYFGGMFLLTGLQERLIFPGHAKQGRAECVVHPSQAAELASLPTPSGDKVVALFGRAPRKRRHARPRSRT